MTIVKTKEKKIPEPLITFRGSMMLQERVAHLLTVLQTTQGNVKKSELYRDALERGLADIEKQLGVTK